MTETIGEVRAAAERLMEAFSTGDVDSGVSFRPGARFGPHAVRQASRMLRPQFHPIHEMEPFAILLRVPTPVTTRATRSTSWSRSDTILRGWWGCVWYRLTSSKSPRPTITPI